MNRFKALTKALAARRPFTMEENGLVIRHCLQRKTTTDHPALADAAVPAGHFDAVFAVMQHQQLLAVLDHLAALDTPLLVLVGNNMSAAKMEQRFLQVSKTPRTVLFGFQGTAGQRENGVVYCARIGAGSMSLGGLHREADEVSKNLITLRGAMPNWETLHRNGE